MRRRISPAVRTRARAAAAARSLPRAIAARRGSTRNSSPSSTSNSASTSRRPSASGSMLKNYLRFDFGKSYFRDTSVIELIKEKLPVSISLGVWMTLISYLDLDSARHRQGGARRLALRCLDFERHHRRLCDPELSLRDLSDRALLRRLLLADLSVARADVREFRPAFAPRQDRGLFLAHHFAGDGADAQRLRDGHLPHQEFLPR